jgi:enediyne biosynthesis protein E4
MDGMDESSVRPYRPSIPSGPSLSQLTPLPPHFIMAVMRLALFLSAAALMVFSQGQPFMVENRAPAAGLLFKHNNFATESKYPFETMGGGVAALDFNNDGWVDLFFLNGAPSPGHLRTDPSSFNRLFKNNGGGSFTDVTKGSGLSGEGKRGYPQGVAVGDYDNDGFVDLFVTQYGNSILYRNNGDGTFSDVTTRAGLAMGKHPFKASACWLDADNDGYLDLFVTHYFHWTFKEHKDFYCGERRAGFRTYCRPEVFQPLPNMLWRNNGDGTFTDVSERAGLGQALGKGMGVAIADYDRDGRMDIFVTNDKAPHFLYHNQGDCRFKEVAVWAGVSANESGAVVSGMGCDFNDYDNDGFPDIFYTDLFSESFGLFRNLGRGIFQDVGFPSGVARFSAKHSGWSTKFMDWDNDGWKDILSAGSHVLDNSEVYNPNARYLEPCFFYRNLGNGKFEDWSDRLGPDFQVRGAYRGLAVADFNNDGTLEAVFTRLNDSPVFFQPRNVSLNWILLDLRGSKSNRDGIGAGIEIRMPSGLKQYNHVSSANGIYSASDKRVHFGLGKETHISRLVVSWPSGIVQTLENVEANQVLTIREPAG